MRRRSVVFIAVAALTGPGAAAAQAAPLPTLTGADGVQVTAAVDGLTARFTGASAAAAARYAGRRLTIACRWTPPPGLLLRATTQDDGPYLDGDVRREADRTLTLRAAATGDPLQVGRLDVCDVGRPQPRPRQEPPAQHRGPFLVRADDGGRPPLARVALTPDGARWVDDLAAARAIADTVQRLPTGTGRYPLPTTPLGPGVAALSGPDAAPAPGTVGYWSDGTRMTVAAATAAGRRLVTEDLGDGTWRSNTTGFNADLPSEVSIEQDSAYDRDRARRRGTPPGLAPQDGVRAEAEGRVVRLRFAGRAATAMRRLAGRRVTVLCNAAEASRLTARSWDHGLSWAVGRVARDGASLRVEVRGPGAHPDVCSVSDDGDAVAYAAATPAGHDLLRDVSAITRIIAAWSLVPEHATSYPAPAALAAAKRKQRLVALPAADAAAPAAGRVGVWTAGTTARIVTRSGSGRVFVVADEGDGLLRTNLYTSSGYAALFLLLT